MDHGAAGARSLLRPTRSFGRTLLCCPTRHQGSRRPTRRPLLPLRAGRPVDAAPRQAGPSLPRPTPLIPHTFSRGLLAPTSWPLDVCRASGGETAMAVTGTLLAT